MMIAMLEAIVTLIVPSHGVSAKLISPVDWKSAINLIIAKTSIVGNNTKQTAIGDMLEFSVTARFSLKLF
jgi:hypothetical protein